MLQRWQKPGDNATVGRFSTNNLGTVYTVSDVWYNNEASYIRLKNVAFSWQVPQNWVSKIKVQSARFRGLG